MIDIDKLKAEVKNDKLRRFILVGIFVTCLAGFYILVTYSPPLTDEDRGKLFRFPTAPWQYAEMLDVISKYTQENMAYVLFAFIYLYVFLQSFAIPGPVILSLLSGQLFGPIPAFVLVCLCATTGASICFAMSYSLARGIVLNRFPSAIVKFNQRIHDNKDNLFFYILFLRFTPLVPNVSINVSAPIVGLPFVYFVFGTLFGLMPGNIIHIQTGMAIRDLNELDSTRPFLMLIGLSILALLPTFFKKKLKEYEERKSKAQQQKSE